MLGFALSPPGNHNISRNSRRSILRYWYWNWRKINSGAAVYYYISMVPARTARTRHRSPRAQRRSTISSDLRRGRLPSQPVACPTRRRIAGDVPSSSSNLVMPNGGRCKERGQHAARLPIFALPLTKKYPTGIIVKNIVAITTNIPKWPVSQLQGNKEHARREAQVPPATVPPTCQAVK